MSASIARYLKDFGDPQPVVAPASAFHDFEAEDNMFPEPLDMPEFAAAPALDEEAIKAQAYAEGYEAASAELNISHETTLAAIAEAHAAELEQLRKSHEDQVASLIADGLRDIAATLASRISDEVADCLAPVLHQELATKAVAAMADLIRDAILEGEAGAIIVKGPLPLFNILATELGEDAGLLRHVEAADLDLSVEMAGSVLVTRMSAFAASLKKVLE